MTETPNSALKESLSALVDGEHNDLDLQRVLKAVGDDAGSSPADDSDESLRATWSRYQAISAVMKGGKEVDLSVDISSSIQAALADEAPQTVKQGSFSNFSGIWRGVGKTAIAASVTLAVVVGVQQYGTAPDTAQIVADTSAADGASAGAVVPQGFELPPLTARTVSTNAFSPNTTLPRSAVKRQHYSPVGVRSAEFEEHVNRLMFKHAEQVSSSGGMGIIPFARVSELSQEEKD